MTPNQSRGNRRSIRLPGYDYTQPGAYFVTICIHQAEELFGEVTDGVLVLNPFGQIAHEEWLASETIRREIELDAFVIMPNHVHGIVWIVPTGLSEDVGAVGAQVGAQGLAPLRYPRGIVGEDGPSPLRRAARSLGSMIAGYKMAVTKRVNARRDTPGAPVWQRNYYEHVIRTEDALRAIREYIVRNPARWQMDRYNLQATEHDPMAAELWRLLEREAC